jgi:hypothetical protein
MTINVDGCILIEVDENIGSSIIPNMQLRVIDKFVWQRHEIIISSALKVNVPSGNTTNKSLLQNKQP